MMYNSFRNNCKYEDPIKDLLIKEIKGKFLTFDEKKRIKKYSEEKRKKNKNKK